MAAPRSVAASSGGVRRVSQLAAHIVSSPVEQSVCIVTGGSSGIGEAVCAQFVQKGYRVINLARRRCVVNTVLNIEVDLTEPHAIELAIKQLDKLLGHGRVRMCLVHCASNYPNDSIHEVDVLGLQRALNLNITVPALLTEQLLPRMASGSSVLFIGSTLSEKAVPG